MCLSKNIRYLRKRKEMSQEDLANYLGYKSYTTIQKWEMGTSEPPIKQVKKMADLFGVGIDDITSVNIEVQENNPDSSAAYYLNDDARDAAEFLLHHPEYKVLFDASRKVKKEDIDLVAAMLERMNH